MTPARHPILVVDDEPEILFSLRGLLRREFELHTAASGAEALEVLRRHPVHAILSDQRMPQMTGVELLRQARGECPEAVRMIFTGYADIKSVVDAVNHGHIYRYLTKPWDPDDLVAVLHEACDLYERVAGRRRLLAEARAFLERCDGLLRAGGDEGLVQEAAALRTRLERALTPEPEA